MINNFERVILNKLLNKYEKSKSFNHSNKVNQKFAVQISALFPQYADHSNFELFQGINEAIDLLVRKKLISAGFNQANVCQTVFLNSAELDQVYLYLGRTQKKATNNAVLDLFERYQTKNEVLDAFCKAQAQRIRANKSIEYFNDDLQEYENILQAVENVFRVESETFVRDFSVRLFKDSKLFERIIPKVVNILYEYGDFPEKEQVLESLNIVRNPTYVNFKGAGAMVLSGQRIDLNHLKSDIAISSALLEDIENIEITGNKVMTIENLTSFHMAKDKDTFLIYLGGFHNRIRRDFIKKVFRQNPEVEFQHFGDIDAGGFYILEHLRRLTGVDFKPFKMDLSTLQEFQNYTKNLTENDKVRLQRLKSGEFSEVVDYMLKNNCKLEQEAIHF